MLGQGSVGKSCLTVQLVSGTFVQTYNPTIEADFQTTIEVDGEMTPLNIFDTSGQEEYSAIIDYHMRKGDGFIIVYSITNRSTYDHVEKIRNDIKRTFEEDDDPDKPMIVCGNKCDLEEDRQVPCSEASEVFKNIGVPFIETSAKKNINVLEAYQMITRLIKMKQKEREELKRAANECGTIKEKKKLCCLL